MAETAAQGNVPTFKLVLVGDGGTGKVRIHMTRGLSAALRLLIAVCMRDKQELALGRGRDKQTIS